VTPTLTTPDPAVFPEAVRHFAAERGVTAYLGSLYELAKRCFGGADVTVTFESDYEIPNLSWIVYHVAAGHWEDEPRQAARSRWRDEKLRALPPSASGLFVLRVQ
jgi:hypothetical protein